MRHILYRAAKWGYKGAEIKDYFFNGTEEIIIITLDIGYEDDFFADLGWDINSTASAGIFTRGIPNATVVSNQIINPGIDTNNDIGEFAFITGNAEDVTWTQDDIDNGYTIIRSPDMDWTESESYKVEFDTWFYIGGSPNVPRDDSLFVFMGNGIEEILIHRETERSTEWTPWSYEISESDIAFSENMYIRVRASDEREGNIVEGRI